MPANSTVVPQMLGTLLLTEQLAAKYDELKAIKVNNFGRGFFAPDILKTRFIAADIRRGSEKVALDVLLGHQGHRGQMAKSTQNIYDPFYYRYYFDATQLEIYWRMYNSNSWNTNDITEAAGLIGAEMSYFKQMIERAYELMCFQIFLTGTATSYKNPSNPITINFGRKAASMVDLGGTTGYWAVSGTDPFADMQKGGDWLRTNGIVQDFYLIVIMGDQAFTDFTNNDNFKQRGLQLKYNRDEVVKSTRDEAGAVYHGDWSCGSYRVRIYTYNQFYDDPTGLSSTKLSYMDSKKIVMLPGEVTPNDFKLFFTATPQLAAGKTTLELVAADYVIQSI